MSMKNGVEYFEIDYVTLYNFLKDNELKYQELSEMLGRESSYISGVLTKNRRVPEDILNKLCDLMGKTRKELLAHKDSAFNTTLEVKPLKEEKEDKAEEWMPFEDRMKKMLDEDPERKQRFMMSEAYRNEVEKGNDVLFTSVARDEFKEKWGRFVDRVCEALKGGQESISVVELVQLMVKGE